MQQQHAHKCTDYRRSQYGNCHDRGEESEDYCACGQKDPEEGTWRVRQATQALLYIRARVETGMRLGAEHSQRIPYQLWRKNREHAEKGNRVEDLCRGPRPVPASVSHSQPPRRALLYTQLPQGLLQLVQSSIGRLLTTTADTIDSRTQPVIHRPQKLLYP